MVSSVNVFEALRGHVGVDLGGADVRVPQHDLNGPKVGAAFQQVARKTVSQAVWGEMFLNAGGEGPLPEQLPKALPRHGAAGTSDEKILTGEPFQQ